jgi:hypothetical protein
VPIVFDRTLTAPTADELDEVARQAGAVDGVYPRRRRDWTPRAAKLRRCLASAEGQRQWDLDGGTDAVAVAWWHDLLGRAHLRLAVWSGRRPAGGVLGEGPPLALLRPELALVRPDDGVMLLCPCGACGTAAQLGWMGDRCGPCHDRGADAPRPASAGWQVGEPGEVTTVALSADGGSLASLSRSGLAEVWDTATGARAGSVQTDAIGDFILSVASGGRYVGARRGGTFSVWDVAGGRLARQDALALPPAAFAADGAAFYAVTPGGAVCAFPLPSGPARVLPGLGPSLGVALSPGGGLLASVIGTGQAVLLWSVAAGAPAGRIDLPGATRGSPLFGPDGRLFVRLLARHSVVLYDASGARETAHLPAHVWGAWARLTPVVSSPWPDCLLPSYLWGGWAQLTPDGRAVVARSDRVRALALPDGGGPARPLFEGAAHAADLLPGGRLLTFSRRDGRVRIWPAEVFHQASGGPA